MTLPALSVVINCHYPYLPVPAKDDPVSQEEQVFFESLSENYLPLLELFERMEIYGVPFRLGMTLSYSLCSLLKNERIMERYQNWLESRIAFGLREQKRVTGEQRVLAAFYLNRDTERRDALIINYGMDLAAAFEKFQNRGRIELLASTATCAFLPFYASIPEAIQAQIETGLVYHRKLFNKTPGGFWLPDLGWKESLEKFLLDYNFSYTIVDEKSLKNRPHEPVQTPRGLIVLGRDSGALRDIDEAFAPPDKETGGENNGEKIYRRHFTDAGFELSPKALGDLYRGARSATGYRYWREGKKSRVLYDPEKARALAAEHARLFLEKRSAVLEAAAETGGLTAGQPISLCVFQADDLGRFWHEGAFFLGSLFSLAAAQKKIGVYAPGDYVSAQSRLPALEPESASALAGDYAEPLLDASNDWIYRHLFRALQRMIGMTERFPADTGLKERALNQAAREVLLAQSSDWAKILNPACKTAQSAEFAREGIEGALRNFTTIYEALGSNYISTEWLTALERSHPLFPNMNYHVFGRKR